MPVYLADIAQQRRDIDVSAKIARLIPDASPFAVILMRAKKDSVETSVFYWYDDEPVAWWTQVNDAAGYTATDTAIVVDDGTLFAPLDIIKVPRTGEQMLVTAVSTNTLTVVRGYGTTAAAALLDNDWIVRLANAMEENSTAPQSKLRQPAEGFNYTQIIRTPFDASMTATRERLKTSENERARLSRNKALEHRLEIERTALFGERKDDIANRRRTTGGVLQFATENVYDAAGALTESEFEAFSEMAFAYGSSRKLLVASMKVLTVLNQFAAGKLQTVVGSDTYGVRMTRYITAHGELFIVPSRTLEKEYSGWALCLDMDNIAYRVARDTTLRRNIQENDRDGWKDEYLTEFGMGVRLPKTHAILKGVTG